MQLPEPLRQSLRATARADLRDFRADTGKEPYDAKLRIAWRYADALTPEELAARVAHAFRQHPEEARQAYVVCLMRMSEH